jgi:hypothetical protein
MARFLQALLPKWFTRKAIHRITQETGKPFEENATCSRGSAMSTVMRSTILLKHQFALNRFAHH